jgi:hypothetical protein
MSHFVCTACIPSFAPPILLSPLENMLTMLTVKVGPSYGHLGLHCDLAMHSVKCEACSGKDIRLMLWFITWCSIPILSK